MNNRKVWLVTGASRGMGVQFAKAALAAGHAVVVPFSLSSQRASDLSRSIGSRVPARSFAARIRSALSP